jgi:hypothetical protein
MRCFLLHLDYPTGLSRQQQQPLGAVSGNFDRRLRKRETRPSINVQVRRAPFFGLVIIGAWDAKGDTVLA